MSKFVHILALLALLVYWSPVRSCVLQQWTVGASCHDVAAAVVTESTADAGLGGCVAQSDGDHMENCLCEQPKLSAGRSDISDLTIDVAAPLPLPPVQLTSVLVGEIPDRLMHPPDISSPARTLPLLN